MNATQPSRPPLRPVNRQSQNQNRPSPYRVMAFEAVIKLVVSIGLSAVATTGLVQLLNYQWFQQEKLQEINAEVNSTQKRVDRLRTDLTRYFDPQQAKSIMREQSNRVDVGQRQIILLDESEAIKLPPKSSSQK